MEVSYLAFNIEQLPVVYVLPADFIYVSPNDIMFREYRGTIQSAA